MAPPPTAVRPAVPEYTHTRRRTNSAIVPALPFQHMVQHHSQQAHTPSPSSLPPQPPPPLPVTAHASIPSPTQSKSEPVPPLERPFFKPPLPWYSAPGPFPGRRRRRRKPVLSQPPQQCHPASHILKEHPKPEKPSAATSVSGLVTPPASNAPSEADTTLPTTPSSTAPPSVVASVAHKHSASIPALPLTPPAVPIIHLKSKQAERKDLPKESTQNASVPALDGAAQSGQQTPVAEAPADKPAEQLAPPPPAKPASWADLLKKNNPKTAGGAVAVKSGGAINGNYSSLEEALKAFQISNGDVISTPFLEPRGLINTGNMCFMNAVLQMLVFCGPFYYFLERVSAGAKSFKDNTPLIETMIMFMQEFRAITSDTKKQIKSEDLEALGEPFAPEFVYEAIRKLKRFSHMRRGHQQDAEEFLGFLLDGLHEEAVEAMRKNQIAVAAVNGHSKSDTADQDWVEVGPKQKTATTRATEIIESPITKIFGGKLRSEFRVPGLTPSITTEPYTPLQLDIQAPEVRSVVDALKHITKPEKIQGDFKSPKGPTVTATKQVFIDSLPPVLILHLKRFQYDNTGGTQKIWKHIAYPLELNIPPEAMSPLLRKQATQQKYRLIGVVYHHGTSASGGHYTVDVLRQDGKNWVRLDDTVIKRVGSHEVVVDAKDIGTAGGRYDGVETNGWDDAVNGNGEGKDSKVAYILFYQRI